MTLCMSCAAVYMYRIIDIENTHYCPLKSTSFEKQIFEVGKTNIMLAYIHVHMSYIALWPTMWALARHGGTMVESSNST